MFFNHYQKVLEKFSFTANRIFNFDKSSFSILTSPLVIAPRGERQVGQISFAERGHQITFGVFMNAMGHALPPAYLFSEYWKNRNSGIIDTDINGKHVIRKVPPGSLGLYTKRGWMVAKVFPKVLEHLQGFTQSTLHSLLFLLLDNYLNCSFGILKYVKENGIESIEFNR